MWKISKGTISWNVLISYFTYYYVQLMYSSILRPKWVLYTYETAGQNQLTKYEDLNKWEGKYPCLAFPQGKKMAEKKLFLVW